MKGILGLLRHKTRPDLGNESHDSLMFRTDYAALEQIANPAVDWETRAAEIGAFKLAPAHGARLLQTAWAHDKFMRPLEPEAIERMAPFFDFATVAADRDVIRQDEHGGYMVVLLSGGISVNRTQPWGERLRLAEVMPGEILGEMSMLDSGIRFSACTTTRECDIAVLSAQALDAMLDTEPALAANLILLLARKLSLRMRIVSARLSDKK